MIPFVDLITQRDKIMLNLVSRITRVMSHGKFILGPEVKELEEKLADFVGVKHCITCASGTDALLIALMALEIGRDDEVITTSFTYVATGEVIARLGAKPVFVDIDAQTYNIDPSKIEPAITSKTKAIMPVSLYGQCADFERINAIAKKYGLPVIEDGAQSFGATQNGRRSCSLSTIGCTSLFPTKPLGCYGDGGACFTDDDELAKAMDMIHKHGQDRRYHHVRMGLNSRLDTIQAAVLLAKLDIFEEEIRQRIKVGQKYSEKLKYIPGITLPYTAPGNTNVFAQYTIRVDDRENFQAALKQRGIPTAVHYPIPLNEQPMFDYLDKSSIRVPVAEEAAKKVVSLPMSAFMGDETINEIVSGIKESLNVSVPKASLNVSVGTKGTNDVITQPKKVLMIAPAFPPITSSGVFRSLKFAKYLPSFDWKPTVIASYRIRAWANFALDEKQLTELPNEVEVIRIKNTIDEELETGISEKRLNDILNFMYSILRYNENAAQLFLSLTKVKEGLRFLIFFPCNWLFWAYDVIKYIEANMNIKDFDVIYTTSDPYSDSLVGFYFKEKYNIPWVADYRDQWTFDPVRPPYNPQNVAQKLLFYLENILLHSASCSLTPLADEHLFYYVDNFALPKEKIVSITNGYDEADFADFPMHLNQTEKFTLTYSGTIHNDLSIDSILKSLQILCSKKLIDKKQIQFQLIGKSNMDNMALAKKYGLENIIWQRGSLSHHDALMSNINSNLLILLLHDDESYKRVYTGKFFDYLRSGRPILAIAPEDGVVDKVLKESGHGKAFRSTQTQEIKNFILDEYRKWKNSKKNNEGIERLYSPTIKRFERKILTKKLVDVFEKVCK